MDLRLVDLRLVDLRLVDLKFVAPLPGPFPMLLVLMVGLPQPGPPTLFPVVMGPLIPTLPRLIPTAEPPPPPPPPALCPWPPAARAAEPTPIAPAAASAMSVLRILPLPLHCCRFTQPRSVVPL